MDSKTRAIVAYLTLIGWIIALVTNTPKEELATYHIRQMLGIMLLGLVCSVVGIVPFIGWLIAMLGTFVTVALWILGLISAINAEMKPVPVVGEKFQEWFQNL